MNRWLSAVCVAGLAVAIGWLAAIGCLADGTEAHLSRGLDLLYEGRYEDAESHFLTLARELGRAGTPEDRAWRARALYHAGRIEHLYLSQPRRAVARLREALKIDPNADFAFHARSEIAYIFYDRLRDYRTAALEFERLVNAFPGRKDIGSYHYRTAQCYFLLREFDQARTEARLILERYQDEQLAADALLLVANAYYVEGRYQEAIEAHQTLLEAEPGVEIEGRSRFELGMCLQELGHNQRAEEQFLLALKIHPRPDIIRHQIALLHERMKQEDDPAEEELPYATATRKKTQGVREPGSSGGAEKTRKTATDTGPAASGGDSAAVRSPDKDPRKAPGAERQPTKKREVKKDLKKEKTNEFEADEPGPEPEAKTGSTGGAAGQKAADNKPETEEKPSRAEEPEQKSGMPGTPSPGPEKKY